MSASSVNCNTAGDSGLKVENWANDLTYNQGAIACYFGKGYQVLITHNIGANPAGARQPTNTSYWSKKPAANYCCSCSLDPGCAVTTQNWKTTFSYSCNAMVLASSPSASPSPSPSPSPSLTPCSLKAGCGSPAGSWFAGSSYICNNVIKTAPPKSSSSSSLKPSSSSSKQSSSSSKKTTAPSSSSCCKALGIWLSGAYYLPNQVVKNKVKVRVGGTP